MTTTADGPTDADGEQRTGGQPAGDAPPTEPELETPYWRVFQQQTARTSLMAMLRRTPRILGEVLSLAWRSSPWATSAVLGFEVASGVLSALGLLATRAC